MIKRNVGEKKYSKQIKKYSKQIKRNAGEKKYSKKNTAKKNTELTSRF
jgi:hypothetical protein